MREAAATFGFPIVLRLFNLACFATVIVRVLVLVRGDDVPLFLVRLLLLRKEL